MKSFVKHTLGRLFPDFTLKLKACFAFNSFYKDSYLFTTGWIRSLKENRPVDINGRPIPWMNFHMIGFLKERLNKSLNLFEFGSGYSTIFYASLVNTVTSVEYDKKWHQKIKTNLPDNVELIFQKDDVDGQYSRIINSLNKKFDVIVVDGRDRVNCVKRSIPVLSRGGVIILDDSEREKYQDGIIYAKGKGFRVLNFEGLKPNHVGTVRSSLLYRDGNCFGV